MYFTIPSGLGQISLISRVAGKIKNHYFHPFYEIFDCFQDSRSPTCALGWFIGSGFEKHMSWAILQKNDFGFIFRVIVWCSKLYFFDGNMR